jgi:hypothetical protein
VRVDWAIPCRYVEVHDNQATIVGAGVDLHTVPQLPMPLQVLFAVHMVGPPFEDQHEAQEHTLACRIFGPDGQLAGELTGKMQVGGEQQIAGWAVHMTIPMAIVFEARAAGSYGVEFQVDDVEPLRVPIHVVLAEAPAAG